MAEKALSGTTIRHYLAVLSFLFEYLCERNMVTHSPVKGVKRSVIQSYEGKTTALGDQQAQQLLDMPNGSFLKGKPYRAMF